MPLKEHPEINENAWSAVTTTDAGHSTLDARHIYIGDQYEISTIHITNNHS